MRRLTAILRLTLPILLGSPAVSARADIVKGYVAFKSDDRATSLREIRPLAEQANVDAQPQIGCMHAMGRGVPQATVYAHIGLNIAPSSGKTANASKIRDVVTKRMTPADNSTAQKFASECIRKKYKGCWAGNR